MIFSFFLGGGWSSVFHLDVVRIRVVPSFFLVILSFDFVAVSSLNSPFITHPPQHVTLFRSRPSSTWTFLRLRWGNEISVPSCNSISVKRRQIKCANTARWRDTKRRTKMVLRGMEQGKNARRWQMAAYKTLSLLTNLHEVERCNWLSLELCSWDDLSVWKGTALSPCHVAFNTLELYFWHGN